MLIRLLIFSMLLIQAAPALAKDGEVECVTTEWKLVGRNHEICVSAFADPDVPGVNCFISQAKTGGVSGSLGLAEDPSNFAISCARTGAITVPPDLPRKANVFKESTSLFFKATRVMRICDKERNTLVYLAISRKVIEGSPFNAISTISVDAQ